MLCSIQGEPSYLYLANDSNPIEGRSFGAPVSVSGEVVFNTGMVGYPEALTDPSYRGQILVLTYPLVGNYGVPDESIEDQYGLPKFFESKEIHISGLIVSSYSWRHSHWAAQKSLAAWLKENNIPGVCGIDTRELTKNLREYGSILGRLEVVSARFSNTVVLWCEYRFSEAYLNDANKYDKSPSFQTENDGKRGQFWSTSLSKYVRGSK